VRKRPVHENTGAYHNINASRKKKDEPVYQLSSKILFLDVFLKKFETKSINSPLLTFFLPYYSSLVMEHPKHHHPDVPIETLTLNVVAADHEGLQIDDLSPISITIDFHQVNTIAIEVEK
jgi:hypothetical protein